MWYLFDAPGSKRALPLEGAAGPGDSGGPAFISEQGRTCVIGVGSGQDHRGRSEGQYGVKEFYTRVSRFVPWIEQTIGQDLR